MPRRVSCPQGHQWEVSEQETAAVAPCPVCGQSTRITPTPGAKTPHEPMATTAPDLRTAPSATPVLSSWPTIEGYEILEELGQGGMGVVYKAKQLNLRRTVAIKLMGSSTTASAERFKIEAEAVAHLQHANIVQIYQVGEQEGRAFLALEFIDGGTLSKKLAQGPLDPYEAARLVETLARALHHAHERGILHRDIKPGNVLLTAEGMPKITDFGLAKRLEGPGVTQTGQGILGTPSYMAPEQAEGKSKKLGPAVDVYALGATLYETLTGRPPFREDTPLETMLKVTREEPLSLSQIRSDIPRDLETICLKCLQKSPALRYASALALAEDLRRFIEGESIHARPPTTWERAVRWLRRRREAAALSAGAIAVLVLLVVMLLPPRGGSKIDPKSSNDRAAESSLLPADLPADLALIPRDASGFVSLNVADIIAREDLLKLYTAITKKLPAGFVPAPQSFTAQIEKDFAVRPSDVTRLTVVLSDSQAKAAAAKVANNLYLEFLRQILGEDEAPLAIVTTAAAYDRQKMRALHPNSVQLKKHRGKDYLVSADSEIPAIGFVTDKVFAVSTDEKKLREFLDKIAEPPATTPLAESLRLAQSHPCVIMVRPSAEQRQEWAGDLKKSPAGKGQTDLAAKMRPFYEMESITFTLDWKLQTTRGDVLQANFYVRYPDEQSLKAGSEALEVILKETLKTFGNADELLKELERFPEFAQAKEFMALLLAEGELALQTARPRTEGRTIHLQLQMRLDIPLLFAALNPAAAKVREAEVRTRAMNNLRQVGRALHSYHEKHGRFPPAVIRSSKGEPLFSWRVEVLPFLGPSEKKLYDEFKRDQPWDSPHNKKLLAKMPAVFGPGAGGAEKFSIGSVEVPLTVGSSWTSLLPGQSRISTAIRSVGWGSSLLPLANPFLSRQPARSFETFVQAAVGPGAAFEGAEGRSLSKDFPDGSSNTILLVEAAQAVPWTKPADVSIDPNLPLPALALYGDGFLILLADGSCRVISRQTPERDLRALFSRNGGEKIDINKLP